MFATESQLPARSHAGNARTTGSRKSGTKGLFVALSAKSLIVKHQNYHDRHFQWVCLAHCWWEWWHENSMNLHVITGRSASHVYAPCALQNSRKFW